METDNVGHAIMLVGFVLICIYLAPHVIRAMKKEWFGGWPRSKEHGWPLTKEPAELCVSEGCKNEATFAHPARYCDDCWQKWWDCNECEQIWNGIDFNCKLHARETNDRNDS